MVSERAIEYHEKILSDEMIFECKEKARENGSINEEFYLSLLIQKKYVNGELPKDSFLRRSLCPIRDGLYFSLW